MERDHKVDRELASLDWTVIRFWGKDIKKDFNGCEKVKKLSKKRYSKKQSYKPRMFIQQMRKHSVNAPIFYFFEISTLISVHVKRDAFTNARKRKIRDLNKYAKKCNFSIAF